MPNQIGLGERMKAIRGAKRYERKGQRTTGVPKTQMKLHSRQWRFGDFLGWSSLQQRWSKARLSDAERELKEKLKGYL